MSNLAPNGIDPITGGNIYEIPLGLPGQWSRLSKKNKSDSVWDFYTQGKGKRRKTFGLIDNDYSLIDAFDPTKDVIRVPGAIDDFQFFVYETATTVSIGTNFIAHLTNLPESIASKGFYIESY